MNSMLSASKAMPANWMKIMKEMPRLIACKSRLHVKYVRICGGTHFLRKLVEHLWDKSSVLCVWPCTQDIWVNCAIKTNSVLMQNVPKMHQILEVKNQQTGSVPFLSAFQVQVWKKHHSHKVGLKQTPLQGHHPSPLTFGSLKRDLSL